MKKLNFNITAACVIALSLCAGRAAAAAPPVAGTVEEVAGRLQRQIDQASEKGNYRQVQVLRLELGEHYAANGAPALAARQYELLLASRPSRRERIKYFIELGRMRHAGQNYGGAIAAYLDALHDDPDSWEANLSLARAYDHAELNTRAIEAYQQCIRLKPAAFEPYAEIADVYRQLGFLNKAVTQYKKALDIDKRPEVYLALADVHMRQGNLTQAREVLRQAKAILPLADYDIQLGEMYRRHGDLKSACVAWEEALRADAKRDDVQLQLALAYDRLNRPADSDRVFKQLLAAYPLSPLVHFARAWVLYARGDHQGSRREAVKVQQLSPTAVVQHYNDELLAQLQKRS